MHSRRLIALLLAALTLGALFLFTCCAEENTRKESAKMTNNVCITVKDYGKIKVELYPDKAPITVENFKKLVSEGHYDGTIFHRVIKGFMIQGGAGSRVASIKGEFASNGVKNDISHLRGVISMARANAKDSASDQFFICHGSPTYLDGNYAAFGKVTEGMEVVDAIASVKTGVNDRPTTDVVIESIVFI